MSDRKASLEGRDLFAWSGGHGNGVVDLEELIEITWLPDLDM